MSQQINTIQVRCVRCKTQWWCCCENMMTVHKTTVINNVCLCCYEHCQVIKEFNRTINASTKIQKMKIKIIESFEMIHKNYGLNTKINNDVNGIKKNTQNK